MSLLLLCLVVSVRQANAQIGREEVRVELERTDRALERARGDLAEHPCVQGQALLQRAGDLQRRAWARFLANNPAGMREARVLTGEARRFIQQSIRACEVDTRAHEALRELFDSTEEMARGAGPDVRASGDVEATRLLDAGLERLQKAREAYRADQFRLSLRLLSVARNLVQRALGRTHGEGPVSRRGVEAALDRTELFLSQVRLALASSSSAPAKGHLDRAAEHQQRAREFARAARFGMALRSTALARSSALEAHWTLQSGPEKAQIEEALEMVEASFEDAATEIRISGGGDGRAILDRVREEIDGARAALAGGDLQMAVRCVKTADSLLRRVAEAEGVR